MIIKRSKVLIIIRIRLIDIFLFFLSTKRVKSPNKYDQKNKEPKLSYIYISKLLYQIFANFLLKFIGERDSKTQKKSILAGCIEK